MDRDQILLKLHERILRFASSRVGKDRAEDLAQDVLVLLHEKYGYVSDVNELVGLSIKIAKVKIWEIHRKAQRRGEYTQVSVDDIQVADEAENPEVQTERKEIMERLTKAIDKLGPRCRQLFLWKLEGKNFPEIQKLFGVSTINTIYTWDFRCRKELLDLMGGTWEKN